MAHTLHRRVILDMDSSESPVHGQQEGAAYNGHFECVCCGSTEFSTSASVLLPVQSLPWARSALRWTQLVGQD